MCLTLWQEWFFISFTQQSALLGNGLVLQNLLHMQLAQQQLLHIKDKRISSVRHLCLCVCLLCVLNVCRIVCIIRTKLPTNIHILIASIKKKKWVNFLLTCAFSFEEFPLIGEEKIKSLWCGIEVFKSLCRMTAAGSTQLTSCVVFLTLSLLIFFRISHVVLCPLLNHFSPTL